MPEARSGRRRGLHLVKRDLAILETLVVRRAETLDWLHRHHFDGLTRKRALNRLGDLVAAGYLHRVTLEVTDAIGEPPASQSVYTLGPRARAALDLRSLISEHFRYRRWNPTLRDSSIPHQIVVNRVAELLRADMVPEHLLPATTREQTRHKPDAVWQRPPHPETRGDTAFLEVDLGHYSRERLIGKYEAFKQDARADVLLVVVPNMTRVVRVAGWLYDAGAPDLKATTGKEIAIWSFDELLSDLEYYADHFGSNPIADYADPAAYSLK